MRGCGEGGEGGFDSFAADIFRRSRPLSRPCTKSQAPSLPRRGVLQDLVLFVFNVLYEVLAFRSRPSSMTLCWPTVGCPGRRQVVARDMGGQRLYETTNTFFSRAQRARVLNTEKAGGWGLLL